MSMNETPMGERIHIGIFGKRNAGKSSLMNAITNQKLAIVSDVKGTTTDPVKKAMELLPLGPVLMIDTPGLDDEGELGQERVAKSLQMLRQTEVVLLVLDGKLWGTEESVIVEEAKKRGLPIFFIINKSEAYEIEEKEEVTTRLNNTFGIAAENVFFVSAKERIGIEELKEAIAHVKITKEVERALVGDLLSKGDVVILVVPIDSAAPKGRLILPQQQVIRDVLEAGAIPVVTRDTELEDTLGKLVSSPKMVITDSQVFHKVSAIVPKEVPLTSFSILMSRYKGDLQTQVAGAKAIENLQDNDVVLISEGCTHHRQCDDIGSVKMPKWIREYTKKDIQFAFTSGTEFPQDLSNYAMVVHCGGCTLNPQEMQYRLDCGKKQQIPITNYGVMIAHMQGILDRVTELF